MSQEVGRLRQNNPERGGPSQAKTGHSRLTLDSKLRTALNKAARGPRESSGYWQPFKALIDHVNHSRIRDTRARSLSARSDSVGALMDAPGQENGTADRSGGGY